MLPPDLHQGPGAPPPPGSPLLGQGEPTPWERRAQLGFFAALWETWRRSMFAPEAFWRSVRADGPPADALFYAWVLSAVQVLISVPFLLMQLGLQSAVMREAMSSSGGPPPSLGRWFDLLTGPAGWMVAVLWSAFAGIALLPLWLILLSAIVHLMSLLCGCAKNGFWATFRVVGYATSPLVFMGVPVLGLGAYVYFVVQQIFGIMGVQQTTGGRATAAVLALPVLLFCCCGGLMFVMLYVMFSVRSP